MEPSNEIKTCEVNGQSIAFKEYNEQAARTVLFVHGNLSSQSWWDEAIAELGNGFHIFAVDMRGFGNSSYNKPITSIEDLATDLKEFCEKKQLNQITLVGWSLGGLVVMKLAELIPDRAANVVLTCSAGHLGICHKDPNTQEPIDTVERVKQNDKHKFMGKCIEDKNAMMMCGVFDAALLQFSPHVTFERKKELSGSAFHQRHYYETIVAIAHPDIHLERTIVKRWLVVVGKEDSITPFEGIEPTIKELQQLGRTVEVRTFEKAAHMVPIEHTKNYAELLKLFIENA